MNSRTFASPSVGMLAGRAVSSLVSAAAETGRSVWNLLGQLGESRARGELNRMADSYALTQPELSAQLRAAAKRNWYGAA
jgi:hypothetical protein